MKKQFQSEMNGMTLGGGSIEHPLSIHSASIGTRWKPRGMQLICTLVLLFTLGIGQMWGADVTIADIDFTTSAWSGKTFSQGNTTTSDVINGIYFYAKNSDAAKQFSLSDNTTKGLTFPNNNMSSGNYYFCIPLTDINGEITVTLTHKYNSNKASYKYVFIDGRTTYTAGNTGGSGGTQVTDAANADTQISFTVSASNANHSAHLCIGRQSSNFTELKRVTVTTPAAADVAPAITAPTTDQSAVYTVGDAITALSVTATGTPAPTYQWYYNSSASTEGATSLGSGAQTASYTPSNAAESDLYYYCIATNSEGSDQSPYFHVTVNAAAATAPSFTSPASEPAVAEYSVGDAISALEVVAAGYPAPTLQWYSNSSKSTEGATLITGAESASYTPSNAAESDLYFYCVATNASGTAQSEYFHVTVAAVSYCAELVPATSGEAIAVGDVIDLQTGSNGGTMTATNLGSGNLAYHANGLGFNSKSGPTVKVVLNHNMKVGTKLWIKLMAAGVDTRGLTLKTKTGTTISAFTCWVKDVNGATNGDVETFTYTVVAGDGLEGTNEFQLVRNNSVWLQSLKVSNCGAELLDLDYAITPAHDPAYATVTLSKNLVAAGGSATATYSDIDAAYEFDGWEITTGDATIADPTAATAAITMGTTASTITLKLKEKPVNYTVTYYDGEESMGTEQVLKDGHPTATDIATRKLGYTFQGWSLTKGGAVKALNEITVTEAMPLYAVYTAVVCPTKGTVFSMNVTAAATTEYNENNAFGLEIGATYTLGIAYSGAKDETKRVGVIDENGEYSFSNNGSVTVKVALDCALAEGDVISFTSTSSKQLKIQKVAGTDLYTTSSKSFTIPAESPLIGESVFYLMRDNSGSTFKTITISRPYTVSFNLNGQSATAIADQKVVAGGKVTEPDPAPSVTGQEFGGWYKEAACTNAWDFANDVVSDDVELFAKWTALPKLTLVANGSGEDDVVSYPTVGDPVAVPANPFTYAGYVFTGWAYSSVVTWVDETHFTMPDANLTLTAQWISASAKAQIVETSAVYETLAEAIAAAAEAGQTVKLLQDIEQADGVAIAKNLTLDLNGKTFTCTSGSNVNSRAIKITAGDVTIKNGSIIAQTTANFEGGCYGPIRIEGATANVTLKDLTLWNGRHYGLGIKLVEGYLRMEDCTVISENGGGGLEVGEATADVINCTFTQTGLDNAHAWISTCLATCDNGVLNVQGGTYTSEHYSMYVYTSGGEMNVESGSFTGDVVNKVTLSSYPDAVGTVNISGGTFEGVGSDPIHFTIDNTGKTSINISGGSFDAPVAEEYCATGYVPETKANGKYGVIVPAQSIDFEAIIDTYGTDATAIAELDAQLAAKHYDIDGTLNDDRLDAPSGKPADKGFKVKKTDLTISFSVEAGKVVEITTGNLSGASIKVNDADATAMTASHTHTYYSDDAQAFLITMTAASNKYNIFKSINIRDPYQVTLDATTNGGEAVAPMYGKLSVILPSATKGSDHFIGWYDRAEEEGRVLVGLADAEYTPTADATLYAHFAAQSNDGRLSDLQVDGTTVDGFDMDVHIYNLTVPYGTAVSALPKITLATAYDSYAQGVSIYPTDGPEWRADVDGGCYVQQANVTAENGSVVYNQVRTKILPKDMACLVWADVPSANTLTYNASKSLLPEDAVTLAINNVSGTDGPAGVKFQKKGYIKIEMNEGTFQAGDVVALDVTGAAGSTMHVFKVQTPSSEADVIGTGEGTTTPVGVNKVAITEDAAALYLARPNDGTYNGWNPHVDYVAVYRPVPNPLVETITFNGAVATVDNDLKTITVEVPASTDMDAVPVVASFLSNDPSQTNGAVTGGTWVEGDNEYIVTDKDNDQTVYTVTITKAVPSNDATLATLTYGTSATAIALADGVFEYNVELPYGTSAVPALAATAHHAGANVTDIDDAAAFVNRHAISTVTVTAENGTTTQLYTVNFTVSRFESKVLWDGSTMTALSDITAAATAAGVTVTTTGISVTSFSAKTCEENGKSYTKALDFGGKTQSSRNFGIEIPAGKVAKVSVVYRAKSTSRSIMIATALSDAVNESTITSKEAVDGSNLYIMTADMFGGGTLYINTTDGFHVHEISLQLADGFARSSMLGAGVLGTVCVPNNVAIEDIQGVTVYELMGRDYNNYGKLAFDEIISGELEAGAPYVFMANGNHMALLYGETHVDDPVDKHNGMYGTFTNQTLTELDDVYYFAQRALWSCDGLTELNLPANRAYVKLSEIGEVSSPTPNPARRRITMAVNGEKVATGIDNLEASEKPLKLMIDGQMYILRGEKLFDATGRLVK